MNKTEFIDFLLHASSADRLLLVREFLNEKKDLNEYLDILLMDPPASTRFSWFLNDVSSVDSEKAALILNFCITKKEQIPVKDIERVIAKQSFFSAPYLPEDYEGEIVEILFSWYANPKKSISTREYSLKALDRICLKHTELRKELDLVANNIAQNHDDKLFRKTISYLNKKFK